MRGKLPCFTLAVAAASCLAAHARAADTPSPSCFRSAAGSTVLPPPDLYSSGGVLNVSFDYITSLDTQNRTLFCFVTPDGLQNPTLHVKPGDMLNIALTNRVPKAPQSAKMEPMIEAEAHCGARTLAPGSVNIHFHGMNIAPTCGSDEVVHTLVNPHQTFNYAIAIPKDEPAGMYWYHPHVHGFSDSAVLAGGTGAIEVEGIENVQPKVAKLPARLLVLRSPVVVADAPRAARGDHSDAAKGNVPYWDLSVNDVPISYPALVPATMQVQNQRPEFWRVVNATGDTVADLVLKYDGNPQPVQIAALDGVATGSQDGTRHGKMLTVNDVLIPPAGRAEFVIPPIPATVKHVTLETLRIDTGPAGDVDTRRELIAIQPVEAASAPPIMAMPAVSGTPGKQRFEDLDRAKVGTVRKLYFSEIFADPKDSDEGVFYVTVDGQIPQPFNANAPPAITTNQGAVEDWVIENRTQEVHEFHIHQIHFQLRAINKTPVPLAQRQFRDTIQVPYWSGTGPYPSVTVRMDFRGAVVGDFVYHCHILDHEDNGMMAIIRVVP